VRIQGLRGRYTQILSDGLPLYGGQSGALSMLQIPPMDLGQVEVIKGVASALYGASALGGVVNLISRRPADDRELLLNQTTRGGTDAILWASGELSERWGYTFLGSGHRQGCTTWTATAGPTCPATGGRSCAPASSGTTAPGARSS
jgi:outer membrane receptor for ferrienterochelin and colicins